MRTDLNYYTFNDNNDVVATTINYDDFATVHADAVEINGQEYLNRQTNGNNQDDQTVTT